ncbi:HPP family protein [Paenibacillus albicereus]|uniref:HPP family protein n=1 Tax=Paenibacillus albicereus TaxID=2726185 RepID=A0A6H2GV99_9BACL|nr:HPP family protein [Paenibacillus albicereus]QJC51340.1 HPP family protein [Paenibacillus albicereus]
MDEHEKGPRPIGTATPGHAAVTQGFSPEPEAAAAAPHWRRYVAKMAGGGTNPLRNSPRQALLGAAGGFAAVLALALLTRWTSKPWLMAPLGASCVLAFYAWDAPLSQPRSIVGGHLISSASALLWLKLAGSGPWQMAAAVATAMFLMVLTKTLHPPAGADPLLILAAQPDWSFLLQPVLSGSLLIVLVALLYNNALPGRRYPTYWR